MYSICSILRPSMRIMKNLPKNGEEIEKYIARMTHFIYRIHTYTHYTVIKWPQSVLSNGS